MQTKDHLQFGRYLAEIFAIDEGPRKMAFILGNIMPDINKFSYIRGYVQLRRSCTSRPSFTQRRRMLIGGHTAEGSCKYVNHMYYKQCKKQKLYLWDYYRIGKALHYLADRFTYPHTMAYEEGFFSHVAYEKELHLAFSDLLRSVGNVRYRVTTCFRHIDFCALYMAYRRSKASVENDCAYILAACTAYLENIFEHARPA